MFEHGAVHLLGAAHGNEFHALRRIEPHRAADQNHARAAPRRRLRQRIAHFPGGTIGEIPHRVQVLARRPRGHDHGFILQIVLDAQPRAHGLRDGIDAGQPSRAGHAAGQVAFLGRNDVHAARAQRFDIFLRRRVLPHIDVHRGSHDHGRRGGQIKRGEKIVGNAAGHLRDHVRRGRSHDEQVNALRDGDVLDRAFHIGAARTRRRTGR